MNRLFSRAANCLTRLGSFQVQRLFSVLLVGCLLLTTGVNGMQDQKTLGENLRQRIEQTDHTDRPKTTGEFLDEARGDVPAGERAKNITRDSVEAFKKLGKEYTPDVGEGVRNLRDSAADAGRELTR